MFNFSNSLISLILYCPFPSYPKVEVFKIPGIKLTLDLNSFWFLTLTYVVVLILHLLTKSFSVSLF